MVLNVARQQSHHLPSKPTRVCSAVFCRILWLLAGSTACTFLATHFFSSTARADDAAPKGAVWITPEAIAFASGPAYGTLDQPTPGFDTLYGAARTIDDNPATHCCLLVRPTDEDQNWLAARARSRKLSGPLGNRIGRLRKAIDALHIGYHDDYPGAAAYLDRLRQIEDRLLGGTGGEDDRAETELAGLGREALLAHPLLRRQPIVFVVRRQYMPDHHNTGTMFQPGEINAGSFRGGGAIKTIDVGRGGKTTTLLEMADGVARDLEVHFDGQTLLFAMRHSAAEPYAIYEMAADGANLRQLTDPGGATDIDPCYLPDGRIVFGSTRDGKFCGCNRHIQANLFVMDADGANIRQIGRNTLFESRPSMLSDGRILYDRWEYVDRHYGPSFGLWTVRPDGTNHALYFGNNAWSPGAIFDAREIPGTQQVVAIFSSCHDRPWGAMVVLDRRRGLDGMDAVMHCWPPDRADLAARMPNPTDVPDKPSPGHPHEPLIDTFRSMPIKYEDPYPLDEAFFLCSRMTGEGEQTGIYLVDVFGNELLLHAESPGCFDPMPLGPRPRPPVLPESELASEETPVPPTGTFYVSDVYRGTGMEQVPRGTIRWIRVVEAPPKLHWTHPMWAMDTHQGPAMNFNCTNNKRILGDAQVEADGSAYFEAPADRFLFFQLLDADKMMVQSMRSGTTLQPGEHTGCVGCHEPRLTGPGVAEPRSLLLALQRPAEPLRPWYGPERKFNYLTEVQPVFDRHCAGCHDYGKEGEAAVNLAGDVGLVFNTSYLDLRRKSPLRWRPAARDEPKPLIRAVDDGPPQVLPPYSWGSHGSRLIDLLRSGHYDVKLSTEEFERIVTWIDMNAPYYGTYATSYPDHPFGRSPIDNADLSRLAVLTGIPLSESRTGAELLGSQVSFTRPELSPCLAKLADDDPRRAEALAIIQKGSRNLRSRPREDMSTCGKPDEGLCNLRTAQREIEPVGSERTTAHHGVEDHREDKE